MSSYRWEVNSPLRNLYACIGLAIWAAYNKHISARAVAKNAAKLGLEIADGSRYFFKPNTSLPRDFIRIGYSSLNETEMVAAIEILKRTLTRMNIRSV